MAFESGSTELLRFFIENGADPYIKNARGEDLLVLAASRFGFVFGHRKISLEFIIELVNPPAVRLVEALKLTGAKLVAFCCQVVLPQGQAIHSHDEVLTMWWRAQKLLEGSANVHEFQIPTEADLESLRSRFRNCTDLKTEAVRIHEEILGEGHCATFTVTRHLTYWHKGQGNMKKAIEMSLKLLLRWNCPENSNPTEGNPVFFYLLHCLCLEFCSNTARDRLTAESYNYISQTLEYLVNDFIGLTKYARKCSLVEYEKMTVHSKESSLLHVLGMALNVVSSETDHRLDNLRAILGKISRLEKSPFARAPFRLLHAALGPTTPNVYYSDPEAHVIHDLPRPAAVRFLISCGFDANGRSEMQETALHICGQLLVNPAITDDRKKRLKEVVNDLLQSQAHWDAKDGQGRMAYEDLAFINIGYYTRLQCLAARVIKLKNISYHGRVDEMLSAFIDLH